MLTIDARCTMRQCEHKKDIYRMVGHCSNCGTDNILILVSAGHEAPRSMSSPENCPICGCAKVGADRIATDDEIPEA